MGSHDPVPVDETVEDTTTVARRLQASIRTSRTSKSELIVVFIAGAIFLACAFSPPHLMDDVDSVQAQIARHMLESGDWVSARLNGVAYLEKSPMDYWLMATSIGTSAMVSTF